MTAKGSKVASWFFSLNLIPILFFPTDQLSSSFKKFFRALTISLCRSAPRNIINYCFFLELEEEKEGKRIMLSRFRDSRCFLPECAKRQSTAKEVQRLTHAS
jgi:hypothetical protein